MARFKFQFESVLEQRRLAEEQCQLAYAKALRQRMILHDQLRNLQQTIRASKQDLRGGLSGAVDLDRISSFARYAGQATQRAQGIVRALVGVEQQIEAARLRLVEAAKARKAVELLHDKHLSRWKQAEQRREEAALDEMNNQAFARRVLQEAKA